MSTLPRNNSELDKIFNIARVPELSEFQGEYFVDMLTGFPSLRVFFHRKVFYLRGKDIVGHNVIFSNLIWGRFFVEYGDYNSKKVAVINYNKPENPFISNRIRDYVRAIEKDGLYLARFNYLFMGKLRFWGYFTLEKKDERIKGSHLNNQQIFQNVEN